MKPDFVICRVEGEGETMSSAQQATVAGKPRRISLETWIGLVAFALAALVRAGVFKHLPW
jgi:hypothetical protein